MDIELAASLACGILLIALVWLALLLVSGIDFSRLAHYWRVVAGQNLTEWDKRYWRYAYRVVYVLVMVVLLVAM